MRAWAFLAVGLALLILQSNIFRPLDGLTIGLALTLWLFAVAADVAHAARPSHSILGGLRPLSAFRPEWSLPATILLGYRILSASARSYVGPPIPELVLPLILFMGVHEYSLGRGAAVAFVIGYVSDVLGIAPVGIYAFTCVAIFVLARAAGVRLAAQTTWMQVMLVGAFSLLQSTMILVLLTIFGRDGWVVRSLYRFALSHAMATASFAPIVFRISQAVHAMTTAASRTEAAAGPSS